MEKRIKRYGNSLVIILDKGDQDIYSLKEGDIVDIELTVKKRRSK